MMMIVLGLLHKTVKAFSYFLLISTWGIFLLDPPPFSSLIWLCSKQLDDWDINARVLGALFSTWLDDVSHKERGDGADVLFGAVTLLNVLTCWRAQILNRQMVGGRLLNTHTKDSCLEVLLSSPLPPPPPHLSEKDRCIQKGTNLIPTRMFNDGKRWERVKKKDSSFFLEICFFYGSKKKMVWKFFLGSKTQ